MAARLGGCPPGWRYPTADSTEVIRLAVESHYFPLFEVEDGTWTVTFRPKHPVPVHDFLATQGRFAHLSADEIDAIQSHVDARWELLERR